MAILLKQSTAVTLVLGPFVDSTDGVTAETALTISQADVRLSKNGAAFAQKNDATSATHMENGHYSVPLNATDTNTLGILRVAVNETGALPVWIDCMVVVANTYDTLISGTANLNASVQAMATGVITAAVIAADAIGASELAADAVTEIQSGLATSSAQTTLQSSVNSLTSFLVTRSAAAQAGAAGSITLDASASATDNIYNGQIVFIVSGTGAGQARLITAYNGTTKVATVTPNWQTNPAAASGFAIFPEGYVQAAAAIASGGITAASFATNAIDAAALAADAVTEIQSGLATAAALATVDARLDTEIPAILAAVDTEVAAIKAKTDNLPAVPAATGDIPSAASIADAVWDEPLAEPSGVFGWAGTFRQLVQWLGALSRNKMTQTTTTSTLRNDADNADIATSAIDNTGGTFTRDEWS